MPEKTIAVVFGEKEHDLEEMRCAKAQRPIRDRRANTHHPCILKYASTPTQAGRLGNTKDTEP